MINSKIYIYIYLDKECITEHDDFGAIFLLRNVLWTAPVGLHYHESRGLPPRDSFFLKLGFTPCKAEQPLQGMELQEKGTQKV